MLTKICRPFCCRSELTSLIWLLGHPFVQRGGVVAGERILIFGRRLPAADAQVLRGLQE
jgi:hypothetical protein